VAQHRNELFAQFRRLLLVRQPRLRLRVSVHGVEMRAAQFGEQLEHADGLGRVQLRRPRVDGAERAEHPPVAEEDRHRYIALESIHRGRVVTGKRDVVGDVLDHHGGVALADLACRIDLQR
jgi:hypothetical protein